MVVKITCYGKTETHKDAREALMKYMSGVLETEGAEQARYISIVVQLQEGKKDVLDVDPNYNPNY